MTESVGGGLGLQKGQRLGAYEILAFLGAGGMGEVYRARDTRLLRDVAIKILPPEVASDPERLRRFEREARAASALNHPNIVTVYEIEYLDTRPFIAMELVEGDSLRTILLPGALPIRKVLQLGSQLADGLARAHEAGIVHRDLKPENVMVTKSGTVKVLDFGLAKRRAIPAGPNETSTPTETVTEAGTVLGTVGYMSPEQLSRGEIDHRADQFAIGVILYELATGRRAFQGDTSVDTMSAILHEEPEPIALVNPEVPTALRWIVERCLAKAPDDRYASTQDLARDLVLARDRPPEHASSGIATRRPRASRIGPILASTATLALAVAAFFAGRRLSDRQATTPIFHQLTFRRGGVQSARFTPDGKTIVYAASWDGAPLHLFSTRVDSPESTPLALPDADLLAVSSSAELLVRPGRLYGSIAYPSSRLARVPFGGGSPRIVAEGVIGADWDTDSRILAVIAEAPRKPRHFEYPLGRVLREDAFAESPRIARDRSAIAYYTGQRTYDVAVMDLSGKSKVLSSGWTSGGGYLAWSPAGDEIWFAAAKGGLADTLRAISLSGRERTLLRLPGRLELQDVSREGRVLLTLGKARNETRCKLPDWEGERDLSWFDGSTVMDLSPDGTHLLIFERGEISRFPTAYLRATDGSPPQRLGDFQPLRLSPDKTRVLGIDSDGRLLMISTGAGEPKVIPPLKPGGAWGAGGWFSDSRHILANWNSFGGHEQDRAYTIDVDTGKLEPQTPEGFACGPISPDGRRAVCRNGSKRVIYDFENKQATEVPGLAPVAPSNDQVLNWTVSKESVLSWSSDGTSLYFGPSWGSSDARVYRLDLASGKRSVVYELRPLQQAGLIPDAFGATVTPDGRSYCYTARYYPNDLYQVEGLR